METAIPDIRRPAGRGDSGDSQTSTLRNTTRPTRGFRRPFRRFFRQNGSNGMAHSDFMSLAAGKSSSSLAGLKLKSVMSLNHIRRRSAADRIIQQSYEEEPAWWEDGMDEAVDRLPLLGATSRSTMI